MRANSLGGQPEDVASRASLGRRRKRQTDQKCLCRSEIPEQGTILMIDRRGDQSAVLARCETRAQIVLTLIIGGDSAAEQGGLAV